MGENVENYYHYYLGGDKSAKSVLKMLLTSITDRLALASQLLQ
jgi:hypothetical protein